MHTVQSEYEKRIGDLGKDFDIIRKEFLGTKESIKIVAKEALVMQSEM